MYEFLIVFGVSYIFNSFLGVTSLRSSGECTDLLDRTIAPGLHYVPGPDTCTLCVCEDGSPKWCKAVLCSPPQDCKSFRVGNSCCDFICLDDTLPKHDVDFTTDFGLRLIASAITAILSLSLLFFLIHRLRQRKIRGRQNRQLSEDERSIGYITGSLAYLPDNMGYLGSGNQERHLDFSYDEPSSHYPLWKPPGNYFPRGEAPPPYEEAVAAARAEAALAAAIASSTNSMHSGGNDRSSSLLCSGTGHRTIPINLATSGSFNIETGSTLTRDRTGRDPTRQAPLDVSDSRRTSRLIMDIPPPLPIASENCTTDAIRSDAFYEDVLIGPPQSMLGVESFNPNMSTASSNIKNSVTILNIPPPEIPSTSPHISESTVIEPTVYTVSTSADSNSELGSSPLNDLNKCSDTCDCSYPCLSMSLPPDDNDDYRSECENCKSMHGSSYYVDEEPNATSPQETMTLHRRPQDYDTEEQAYYPTSLTLPTHTKRQRSLPLQGPASASFHGARENWFSSMPASSTSSSEGE